MSELTCIICPMGCRITVEQNGPEMQISGNSCRRGETYAREESVNPKRMVTGVVLVIGSDKLLPVKTAAPIPKNLIFKVMAEIRKLKVNLPVKIGQPIVMNIAGTGVSLIATKNIN